jgi:hypothetical protein
MYEVLLGYSSILLLAFHIPLARSQEFRSTLHLVVQWAAYTSIEENFFLDAEHWIGIRK